MSGKNTALARAAIAIRAAVAGNPARPSSAELPRSAWQYCDDLVRKIRKTTDHGWQLAVAELACSLRYEVARVRAELADIDQQLAIATAADSVPLATDIHRDLAALGDEFSCWSCDRANKTLSVTTSPIELAGIYLGPFEIRLNWDRIRGGDADTYRVIALDPRPSATDSSRAGRGTALGLLPARFEFAQVIQRREPVCGLGRLVCRVLRGLRLLRGPGGAIRLYRVRKFALRQVPAVVWRLWRLIL